MENYYAVHDKAAYHVLKSAASRASRYLVRDLSHGVLSGRYIKNLWSNRANRAKKHKIPFTIQVGSAQGSQDRC